MKLDIAAVHFELDAELKGYVQSKVGKLDRFINRKHRDACHGRVVLTEDKGKASNRCSCEVTLTFPHGIVAAKDSGVNMFAAVDTTEAKVKAQLLKHKSKVTAHHPHKRLARKLRGYNPFN